ncbi:4-coumarate--CoA ligase-like 4 [Ananas comosus]|uniref:4-coumarate--CoA ligase n=1 Tax=Ananas comosus TaxID=4615 RepID=A0A199VGN9_ANACO|nr:4-coumarate--CoA ligase-like 4 [Ananas comosus]
MAYPEKKKGSEREVDPRSGFCAANATFYSKRRPVALPAEPDLDVTTFLASRRHSGTTALIDAATGRRVSFPELWRSVAAVASSLRAPPLPPQGRVVLSSPPTPSASPSSPSPPCPSAPCSPLPTPSTPPRDRQAVRDRGDAARDRGLRGDVPPAGAADPGGDVGEREREREGEAAAGAAAEDTEVIEGFRRSTPGSRYCRVTGSRRARDRRVHRLAEESRRYGTAGLLSPNTEARIVDPDTGKPLPVNRTGELWIRGPYVMKGYFKNEEATRSTLDSEGWLRTGDLCYIDEDGYLFVVDRLKELIKYKGYQVPPAELEALLLTHPDVADAAVIPFPDREAGQVPMAYVVRKDGSQLSESEVMKFVEKQVAPYKKIRKVAFVSDIPKNASGKILRKDLIKLATASKL